MFFSASTSPRFLFALILLLRLPFLLVQALSFPVHAGQALGKRDAVLDSGLTLASWIWLPEPDLTTTAPTGTVAFIKTFATPAGKVASSALIAITVDNNFTLWVNGQPIGYSGNNGFQSAQIFHAQLNTSANVFSVLGTNASPDSPGSANPAGLLAAIHILYSDNSNDTVVSDKTWLVSGTVPGDFPLPADISQFVAAEPAALYGSGPWGQSVTINTPASNALTLMGSSWLWSTADATTNAPPGSVGFRKTVATPGGKTASSATILLSADNTFSLYVNKQLIGSPPYDNNVVGSASSWEYAQRFNVALTATTNIITVVATNFPAQGDATGTAGSSAGFIAAIQVQYTDGSTDTLRSDVTWLAGPASSATSFLAASDASLAPAVSQGSFGVEPWGQIGVVDALNTLLIPGNNAAAVAPQTTQTIPTSLPLKAPTSTLPGTLAPTTSPAPNSVRAGIDARTAPLFVCFMVASFIL
ncbi:hypothetical protein FB451DRAFT_624225 [Mycena latifolia]|nr:hypothetical protein FB451DRAFT_624225 [Mycena latifolia]